MLLRASLSGLIFAVSTLLACSGSEHQLGDQSGAGSSGRAGSPGSGGNAQAGKGGSERGGTSSGGTSSGGTSSGGSGGVLGKGGAAGGGGSGGEGFSGLARDCVESGGKIATRRLCGGEFPDDCVSSCFPDPGGVAGQSGAEGQACDCPTDQCFKLYGLNGAVFGKCEPKSNWEG